MKYTYNSTIIDLVENKIFQIIFYFRNFSDLAFRDFQDGNDHMIIQLREHKHLVSCLIETVRLCVTKFDEVESQCVENCMCTLENLSHDVIDERHEEEHSHKISGITICN